jgi:hypothetical protein
MILIPYYTAFPGQLPVMAELTVSNITFSEVATALKVMCFDMELAVATSYNPLSAPNSSGEGTSAWAYVRDYDVDTATMPRSQRDVYVMAETAVAAGAKGNAIVMGRVTGAPKVGSAAHVLGQGFTPSMGTVGTLAPTAAVGTTLVTTLSHRKIVFLATNAATAAVVTGFFNGLGFGSVPKNVAYNAD